MAAVAAQALTAAPAPVRSRSGARRGLRGHDRASGRAGGLESPQRSSGLPAHAAQEN
ncbi:hypothetical protein [Lysobacter gummosus]|uniref:hypothetical protein n=1 Tax=Lysobacter gummosus TaxID=262324 RepID=UPI00362E741F